MCMFVGNSWQNSLIWVPHFAFSLGLCIRTLNQLRIFFCNCAVCVAGQLHNLHTNNHEQRLGEKSARHLNTVNKCQSWWLMWYNIMKVWICVALGLRTNESKLSVLTCRVLTWSGVPPVPLTVLFLGAGLFPAAFSLDAILAFSASMRLGLLSITWTTAYSTRDAKPKSRQAMSHMSIALT